MNCWRAQLFWSLIFCKTYKFTSNMWCVMCDACYVMFHTNFCCKILTLWVNGRPKIPQPGNFRPFWVIFQNWSQVAVICTLYLARPHIIYLFTFWLFLLPKKTCGVRWSVNVIVTSSCNWNRSNWASRKTLCKKKENCPER